MLNQYDTPGIYTSESIKSSELINGEVSSYAGIEPRLAIRYKITNSLSARASVNKVNQYIQLLSNTATPTPVDIWQLSTPFIKPLRGTDYGFGVSQSSGGVDYSFDLFYKSSTGNIDFRDFADLLLQPSMETQVLSGIGRSYGSEFSINKREGKITGRMSYAYIKSERQILPGQASQVNNGDWYPSAYDQPHNLKIFFNWQMSKASRLNINFIYNTGRPITAPIANYIIQGVVVSNFSERNAFRVPDYHRLDIGLTTNLNRRKSARYKSEITFSLYNFYARRNAFSIFFRQEQGSIVNALRLSVIGTVIPSVSYSFQF
jgi:hypothetical protein